MFILKYYTFSTGVMLCEDLCAKINARLLEILYGAILKRKAGKTFLKNGII